MVMLGATLEFFMCYRSTLTNLDTVPGKLSVKLVVEMREIPESLAAPDVDGAILTRMALRSRREMYTSISHIPATNGCNVVKEEVGSRRWYMYYLFCPSVRSALASSKLSDILPFKDQGMHDMRLAMISTRETVRPELETKRTCK